VSALQGPFLAYTQLTKSTDENRVESRDPGAENKTVTGTTFMRFRGPGALDDSDFTH
jgi:hypothetical protein